MQYENIIVVSDLDGTLTDQVSSWQYVFEQSNLWIDKAERNLELFLNKEIDYDKFIDLDVKLLKGLPVQRYLKIIDSINFRAGLHNLFNCLKTYNSINILVSSGLMDLATRISNIIPFSEVYANKIHHNGKILNGEYDKIVGWDEKGRIMKRIRKLNPNSFIIAFGDTSGDLPLIENSDLNFACFSNSKELNSAAQYKISNLQDAISIIKKTFG